MEIEITEGERLRRPELPAGGGADELSWGSDAVAETLRRLEIPYLSLTPGASYRGLHDSVVNYLGNERPQMLLCLHEEHAVAIAHGYAKVTERPLAVALHSNVGLMHASMSIFNAFCDRVPMLILGATGPVDAARRRPWIDWLHTAADQAALVRPFVKWDDQPGSAPAAIASILRGWMLTGTRPRAPVYVCLDVTLQEEALSADVEIGDVDRFQPAAPSHADPRLVAEAARLLRGANAPVILAGRVSRDEAAWVERVELAERVQAKVFTHLKLAAAFPTDHPLHAGPPSTFASPELRAALREADLVLDLDWLDLGGTCASAERDGRLHATVVSVSADQHLHGGWGKEHMEPAPADLRLLADPDAFVHQLLAEDLAAARPRRPAPPRRTSGAAVTADAESARSLGVADIATVLASTAGEQLVTLVRVPTAWPAAAWHFRSPLDFLGGDGGEGVGSGPGLAVGAALALSQTDRLPVAVLGDGDFLMGVNALWTAAHYGIPLLVIVANNRSFFNDELHQQYVAEVRGRPTSNRWVGQRIDDPPVDLAGMARAQGLVAYGPVEDRAQLETTLARALREVRAGAPVVVDVLVETGEAAAAILRTKE